MKEFNTSSFSFKRALYFFGFLLIAGGLILRFYNLRFNTRFEWDQENLLAYPAKSIIVDHKLTLIGAKASTANLYVGPLYSYLAAGAYKTFGMDPIAGPYLAGILSIITIVSGYFFIKKIAGSSIAYFFTLFFATSPVLLSYDRVPWNVNLLLLSSILSIGGLFSLITDRKKYGWILIGLGLFIGINSHYSIFLILLGIILVTLLERKIINRSIGWAFLLSLLGILPLIIFNLRHPEMISQLIHGSGSTFHLFVNGGQFLEILKRILQMQTSFILVNISSSLFILMSFFILISFFAIKSYKNSETVIKILFVFSVIYSLAFSMYSGATPDYYFLGLVPLFLWVLAILSDHLRKAHTIFFSCILLFCSYNLLESFHMTRVVNPYALGFKQELVKQIQKDAKNRDITVVFDMEKGESFGYQYLFDYYGINTSSSHAENTYWVSYPSSRFPGNPDFTFGDIALGLPANSERIRQTKDVSFFGNSFFLRVPKNWSVLECGINNSENYLITPNLSASCASYETEKEGIAVRNIFDCNPSDRGGVPLEGTSLKGFYTIQEKETSRYSLIKEVVSKRCVSFTDMAHDRTPTIYPDLENILTSFR